MATTALTITDGPPSYSLYGKGIVPAAADASNGNHVVTARTKELLVAVYNAGVSTRTITITSQPLTTFARTGDVNARNVAAGELRIFRLLYDGWANPSDSKILISGSHADLKIAVFDLTQQSQTA